VFDDQAPGKLARRPAFGCGVVVGEQSRAGDRKHGSTVIDPVKPGSISPFVGEAELAERMRALDWSATPLGPVDSWPASLRSVVRILLTSRFSMWLGWGSELTFFYNDAYRRDTLRAKHPWALGRPAREVWAEIWQDIGPRIQSVLATGVATWDEGLLLFLERAGYPEETYHTFSYSPLADEDGQVVGMLCVVSEDTDRVLSERRMATLGELAAALAAARTRDDIVVAVREQLGRNTQDVPFSLIYLFDDAGMAHLACTTGIEAGAAGATRKIGPDGADHDWPVSQVSAGQTVLVGDLEDRFGQLPAGAWTQPPRQAALMPLAAAQGQGAVAGLLVVGLNPHRAYDDRYRGFIELVASQIASGFVNAGAYEAERRRAEALAELDRAKTDFFSNVSHEFRTPLTLIMGPVTELRSAEQVDPVRLRTELEVIHRNGLRLGKLVNTLLDFSRLQAGRVHARYEPLDLGVVTAELASVFRSAIERAGLRLEADCTDLGEPVYVDREMWEKVVLNLLSNALKFTFDGHITVTVRRRGDSAVLTVTDTGTGIPAEELPRLFDRFHRVRGARSRSHEGSGIGLALVAELVALHGGQITADSTPDVGTTVTVTLPLGKAHLPADQIVPPSPVVAATEAAAPFVEQAYRWLPDAAVPPDNDAPPELTAADCLGPTQRGRVLVADDNADMREYLARLLGARYEVQTVSDGVAALAAATAARPDLILSDVMMPGMDGLALLAALRGDVRTMRMPVLLLSARAGQEAAVAGLAAGADDYLIKPFSAEELLARVDAHLQLGRIRREAEQRLESLQQATAALSAAATPAEVAQTAVTHLAQLLGAATTTLHEVRETGTLEWVAGLGSAPELARNWSTLPLSAPVAFADAARRRRPVWLESLADCDQAYPGLAALATQYGYPAQANLPVVIGDRCLGVLGALFDQPRQFSQAERATAVTLAELCAQAWHRAQLLTSETAARHTAERLNRLVGALSGATGVAAVAQVILGYADELGADAAVVVGRGTHGQLPVLATRGYPEPGARLAMDAAHPLAHAVRTAQPVWRGSRSAQAWQDHAFDADGPLPVQVAVPLIVGDTVIGALGFRIADQALAFTPEERAMILTLAGQCAQALDRARLYQAEHHVAQTLQRSLLPRQLPEFDRLALAARYLPGAPDVAAGGDWYDVLALSEHRVAIVVGDVVGRGVPAAAVMGQLRTALAAYLLDGHGPAAALERLDRLATRIPGARASTTVVVIVDLITGQLCWARAGHPPPLLVESDQTRYLTGGAGGPLAVHRRPPYTEAITQIQPGACLLLYTDGLIERRGQVLDEGLDHLVTTAAELCVQPPTALLDGLLAAALPDTGPADDIALIAARYLPAPLHQQLPADPARLIDLRRAVRVWARTGGLPTALSEDLQLTLGEAAANAVEHAYATASEPGEFTYLLTQRGDGGIDVEVRDFGCWRPEPSSNRHRGRGLSIIRDIATDVVVEPSPTGTQIRFLVPSPSPDPAAPPAPPHPAPATSPTPTELHVHQQLGGGRRLELRGELDLTTAATLRDPLLGQLHAPGPITLDLRAVEYLSSAGVGLLIDAAEYAEAQHLVLQLQLAADSLVARLLTLTGLDTTLLITTDPAGVGGDERHEERLIVDC
jgi:anti-anti-sigma factor